MKLNFHQYFQIAVVMKLLNAVLEVIGGILFWIFPPNAITNFVAWITQNEISEDPSDLLANYLVRTAQNFSVRAEIFWIAYLLSHGILKILLVAALLKRQLWAYPVAIAIFSVFIVYQIYLYFFHPSFGLIALSVFDLAVIYLTGREYRNLQRGRNSVMPPAKVGGGS